MKISLITLLWLSVLCYGCSNAQNKTEPKTINIQAIKLNNEAVKLYFKDDFAPSLRDSTLRKVLDLLNQAIAIDSNYHGPCQTKMAIEDELDQRDSAFLTAKLIIKR